MEQDHEPMGASFPHQTVIVQGDEVTCTDFSGFGPDGDRPGRLSDECQAALSAISEALADHGLTLGHTRHVAAMIREGQTFAQCQAALNEALAAAKPALTLRIVQRFPLPEQRIALSLTATPNK
ncbi:endoribonuclease L-PSP [Gluconobacter oxydans]|uniref:endoribonuclease L-PSP n=1 Tax=Gluconobacter oxydans TaxID=442 RepID=UPI002649F940|nr:endoribonuclease L-PSP [Gluconobacter oxydans]WKE48956.1 endoribonuclease L-PSP [Gluconobacter oxydans]